MRRYPWPVRKAIVTRASFQRAVRVDLQQSSPRGDDEVGLQFGRVSWGGGRQEWISLVAARLRSGRRLPHAHAPIRGTPRGDRRSRVELDCCWKPTFVVPHGGGKRFMTTSLEYQVIAEWIAAGALPPSNKDARVTGLTVYPSEAEASRRASSRLSSSPKYSDGHSEDATRWAEVHIERRECRERR